MNDIDNDTSLRKIKLIAAAQTIYGINSGRENYFYINSPGFHTYYSISYNKRINKKLGLVISPSVVFSKSFTQQKREITFPYDYPLNYWNNYIQYISKYDNSILSNSQRMVSFFPNLAYLGYFINAISLKFGYNHIKLGSAPADGLLISKNSPTFPSILVENNSDLKYRLFNYKFFWGILSSPLFHYSIKNSFNEQELTDFKKNPAPRLIAGFDFKIKPLKSDYFFFGINFLNLSYFTPKNSLRNIVPIFTYVGQLKKQSLFDDILASSTMYFKLKPEKEIEFWGEYGFANKSITPLSLFIGDTSLSGYLFGSKKTYNFNSKKSIELFIQLSNLQTSTLKKAVSADSWYSHGIVRQGATNQGRFLGNGIGPGSNSFYTSISLIKDLNTYGISFERLIVNNDFLYANFRSPPNQNGISIGRNNGNYRRHWMDLSIGFHTKLHHKNSRHNFSFIFSKSFNNQWRINENSNEFFKDYGYDLHGFRITYAYLYL